MMSYCHFFVGTWCARATECAWSSCGSHRAAWLWRAASFLAIIWRWRRWCRRRRLTVSPPLPSSRRTRLAAFSNIPCPLRSRDGSQLLLLLPPLLLLQATGPRPFVALENRGRSTPVIWGRSPSLFPLFFLLHTYNSIPLHSRFLPFPFRSLTHI